MCVRERWKEGDRQRERKADKKKTNQGMMRVIFLPFYTPRKQRETREGEKRKGIVREEQVSKEIEVRGNYFL